MGGKNIKLLLITLISVVFLSQIGMSLYTLTLSTNATEEWYSTLNNNYTLSITFDVSDRLNAENMTNMNITIDSANVDIINVTQTAGWTCEIVGANLALMCLNNTEAASNLSTIVVNATFNVSTAGDYVVVGNITSTNATAPVQNGTIINLNTTAPTLSGAGPDTTQNSNAVVLIVTTSTNANCKYSTTASDGFYDMSTNHTNGQGGLAHNTSATLAYDTTYTYYYTCASVSGVNASPASTTFYIGAIGGVVIQPAPPDPNMQSSSASVSTGDSATYRFTKNALSITQIQFTATEQISSAKMELNNHDSTPGSGAGAVSGYTAYKYVSISATRVTNDQFDTATISFKVPLGWYNTNSLDPATTKLMHYVNNVWNELPTTMTDSDTDYHYFEATTTSFSEFAIVAGTATVVCTEAATQSCVAADDCAGTQTCTNNAWETCEKLDPTCTGASCSDGVQNGDETGVDCGGSCPTSCDEDVTTGGLDMNTIIIIIVIVVVLGAAYAVYSKKQ